jgi:hypothetical protein
MPIPEPPHPTTPAQNRPVLRVHLEGENAKLGRVAASDVAQLILAVERAVARAASVVVGRPSRKPGARELVINEAAHLVLVDVEDGSVTPVLEVPAVAARATPQDSMELPVSHLGEIAVEQVIDVLSERIDGHPYVVEALATMAKKMRIGDVYQAIRMDYRNSHDSVETVTLDGSTRKRLADRVKADRAATREGMVVGTLVEADFESNTARLRSAAGRAVLVSFDPSLSEEIKAGLREPAEVEGWVTYDPSTQEVRAINLRTVRRGKQLVLDVDPWAFRHRMTFKELQAEQGVSGIFNTRELHDSESSETDLDAYEEALQQLREA